VPGATYTPADEDCLFLNVYAPPNATELPVLVWIHGGGYGLGDGTQDMSEIINANNQGFVAVTIQYRVSPQLRLLPVSR
jgi:carboxylesterase type B